MTDEIVRLLARMEEWEADVSSRDGTCVKCNEPTATSEPDYEPSPLCHACAQDLATRVFPDIISSLRRLDTNGGDRG